MAKSVDLDLDEDFAVTKQQVRDSVPKRIKELQFGILCVSHDLPFSFRNNLCLGNVVVNFSMSRSSQETVKQSVAEVSDRNAYDIAIGINDRGNTANGTLDRRMGVSSSNVRCETCDRAVKDCNGHFGHVKLALPVFHIGFLKKIIEVLHCICKECSKVLLTDKDRRAFLLKVGRPGSDGLEKKNVIKKIIAECRKVKYCPHCNAVNGTVKKVSGHALKITHDKYRWYNASSAKTKVAPLPKVEFDASFEEAKKGNPELDKHFKKAVDDLNPLRVLNLFKKIEADDCELLGMNPNDARPEMLILQYMPAPPVNIRPSVKQDTASNEDDITNKLGDIVHISSIIRSGLEKGQPIQTIMEQWDYLQIQVAMFINSEVPNLQQAGFGKPIRGFCQRLKGKQGRFRGNLSGKRVDFSGRTVISPDPNLSITEVGVPKRVAGNLTYPEHVTQYNFDKLRNLVRRGHNYPGANFITKKKTSRKLVLSVLARLGQQKLNEAAEQLQIGDIVERHLEDGDIVLFNRQPSLHKLSIMCHRVKVHEWRTFRLNECVCGPYNADFDGDEMNLHVPQTEEARTEALELMGVKHNLATPKDGTPIIAATQDFITAAYLLSSKDRFYDRKTFCQICCYMFDGNGVKEPVLTEYREDWARRGGMVDIDLPEPAIWRPEALWTGKQVFNVLMRPSLKSPILVNFDGAGKQFKAEPGVANDLIIDDSWLVVRNSEVMCGMMDKSTMGSGKKDSVFYVIMRDFGADAAVQAMDRLSKLSARWLTNEGFSIGIDDVYPSEELVHRKQSLIAEAYNACDDHIKKFKAGTLVRSAGSSPEETMEHKISGILSEVRQKAGAICFSQLSKWNSPIIMAKSGSKGSNINVSQMVAAVGQQIIGGTRITDGFQDRTLPHFPKAARQPPSKGFVGNSFFSGLTPTEFIFHAMSGREGLVDTAVKTAETGYMSRRLMKSLEDLSAQYDNTVRTSSSSIVQFQYGEDSLDPVDMEGKAKPVNFERTFSHAQTITWSNDEYGMYPWEVKKHVAVLMNAERQKVPRMSLMKESLAYNDETNAGIDQLESRRGFINEVEIFINEKADLIAKAREHLKMDSMLKQPSGRRSKKDDKLRAFVDSIAKLSQRSLEQFVSLCLTKYFKARTEPGHAVGAVGAQSIGEPGTQMTLKTFHFAGVAGMSITQGVPRIKEIINGSKHISTPIIDCELANKTSDRAAYSVKALIEKTYLSDVIDYIDESWNRNDCYLKIHIDRQAIQDLQLDVGMFDIKRAILKARGLKLTDDSIKVTRNYIFVQLLSESSTKSGSRSTKVELEDPYFRLQSLKRTLPNVVIKGFPQATRAIIAKSGTRDPISGLEENCLKVEGYGLAQCMTTPGVVGERTTSNNIIEVFQVLGVEAARKTIIAEIDKVMGAQMDIDPRHMQLLADVMTFKGEVLGITRFGLAKMRDSVLQLASFEKTPDHLFEAAVKGKKDAIEGVSECIIMGQSMSVGTGAMSVFRDMAWKEEDFKLKPTIFEEACKEFASS
ncbi:hypothetical protein FH972_026474 [Carpinus fangiana]|uniref:DNA-directed RNA polymerase subunit n=1 Tax=Carpinus fangiana TaxID=176857 RepID=A0A5N6L427_9ROSI|nr:hypothetical protein FH972_026474 [Carpinus fangiana]